MPKIYLYAEILIHIRQLTLYASLQTEKAEGTKLDVSSNKKVITVVHDGETQNLYLPTQILGTAKVTFPTEKKTEISARVQIDDEYEWKSQIKNEIEAPWTAPDLTSETSIKCLNCKASILAPRKVKTWKALPSENWADFMDFWFCHKPHDNGQNDAEDAAKVKGFSSNSKLAVTPGTGMIDLTSIVLHIDDCTNIKAAETFQGAAKSFLRCKSCATILGLTNRDEDLLQLQKSSISLRESAMSREYQSYHSAIFSCARILSLIETTSIKKFVIHSTSDDVERVTRAEPLLIWVFNPDIYYSCSAYDSLAHKDLATAAPKSEKLDTNSKSQNHNEHDHDLRPETNTSATGNASQVEQANHRNPNNDDTSQIYGETPQTQLVTGDIEMEVPMRSSRSPGDNSSSTPVDSITFTETDLPPLISQSTNPQSSSQAQFTSTTSPSISTSQTPDQTQTQNHHNLVHRAAKIFYKPLSSLTDLPPTSFLDQPENSTTYEDLALSDPRDLSALWETLETSTAMLPQSARSFQDWFVGLLERYEKVPSGLGVMQDNPLARGVSARDGRVTRWDIGHGAEGLYA